MDKPKIVGIKSGCFTILTAGHVFALTEAKKKCDRLVVIVNDDDYINRKKGSVPIPQKERVAILQALDCVDEAIGYSDDNEHEWVKLYKEEIMPKYGDSAELIVFHDEIMLSRDPADVPGVGVADKIIILTRNEKLTSVSEAFAAIGLLVKLDG